MAIKTLEETKKVGLNTIAYGYAYQEDRPNEKKLIYEMNKNKRTLEFYPYSPAYYFFEKLTFMGFSIWPDIVNPKGFLKNKLLDYIHKVFKDKKIKSIIINRSGQSKLIKKGKDRYLHLSYANISSLSEKIGSMNYYHRHQRTLAIGKHFNDEFPKLIKIKLKKSPKDKIREAIQVIATEDNSSFEKEDISRLTDILSSLMKSGHKSQIAKSQLFKNTKLKFDTVTLDEVIKDFEQKLSINISESDWGKFLEDNLFLIDSKYIHSLPQLNLVLGSTRKVDFGLIDIQGYLDIFEIKKPDTKLVCSKKDTRGNYVWDKQAIEAIVQAEKYLLHAESKSSILKDDIKKEKGITLDVIRPRAFVIIGNSSQLDTDGKRADFRMLRNQFKNIEIILYDELLERIRNQKKSIEK